MYEFKDGILTCQLPNGCYIKQERHPQTNEAITEENAADILRICIGDEQWLSLKAKKYENRIQSSARLIAEMAVENEQRVKSNEWSIEQLQTVLKDKQISNLVLFLQMASFQTAMEVIRDLKGDVYTEELKAAWIKKIQAAM